MALGVPGTGPYGKIRDLQNEIKGWRYELRLLGEGMKRPLGKEQLERLISDNRAEIHRIKAEAKKKPVC